MRLTYTRKFDACHQLCSTQLNDAENVVAFGKCRNWHGHSWLVTFIVDGNISEDTGMVVNFAVFKEMIDALDHGTLNDVLPLPTAENLVLYFIDKLRQIKWFSYISVEVFESELASASDEWSSE